MTHNSYVSLTELKSKPMNVFSQSKNYDSVIVMKRSDPVGVLLSTSEYNRLKDLDELGDRHE